MSSNCVGCNDSSSCNECCNTDSCESSSDDTCIENMAECSKRKKCLSGTKKYKTVVSYCIDTCLISYKPRLIVVPSCKFPNIDCAFSALRERKGGYVIKLKPGTHRISTGVCRTVDDVTIIGDNSPFAGYAYIQTCREMPLYDREYCDNSSFDPRVGTGPYNLCINGRRLTVTGSRNPDFSSICAGRRVGILRNDRTLLITEVGNAIDNNITFVSDTGISPNGVQSGEGFFFIPNVSLVASADTVYISPSGNLKIEGVTFESGEFSVGTQGGLFELGRSVLALDSQLSVLGNYAFYQANTFTNIVHLIPISRGITYNQAVLGALSRVVADTIGTSAWKFATFAGSQFACRIINGSIMNLLGSQFVNNCVGLNVGTNSHATIYGVFFCNNYFGAMAVYNSAVTSDILETRVDTQLVPVFIRNNFAINVSYGSYFIIENATYVDNLIFAIIDSKAYIYPDSNPVGSYGTENSIVIDTTNLSAVEAADTLCVPGIFGAIPSGLTSDLFCVHGLHATVDRAVIQGRVAAPVIPACPTAPSSTPTSGGNGSSTSNNSNNRTTTSMSNLLSSRQVGVPSNLHQFNQAIPGCAVPLMTQNQQTQNIPIFNRPCCPSGQQYFTNNF